MILQDLRSQAIEKLNELKTRILESGPATQALEWYEGQEPKNQKAALAGATVLLALLFLMIPLGYYSTSSSSVSEYEDLREIMHELAQVRRDANLTRSMSIPATPDSIKARLFSIKTEIGLQPNQSGAVNDYDNATNPNMTGIPKNVQQQGVEATYSQLNLKQVVQLAQRVQSIENVKMVGVDIKASTADPHFFDVVFKLIGFTLAPPPPAVGGKKLKPAEGN